MRRIWDYLIGHPDELLFATGIVIIGYLIARLINVRPVPALVFGFLPLFVLVAFTSPSVVSMVMGLMG